MVEKTISELQSEHDKNVVETYIGKQEHMFSMKQLENILKTLGKKETYKIVLENGFKLEPEKMSFERKAGVHLAIDFIRCELKKLKKESDS